MADILEYLSRDHRITFETVDQIRVIPRSDLPPQEQLRASLRFREAEVVLCKRVRVHVIALAQLASQINDVVDLGQHGTNFTRKRFDGVPRIAHTGSTRQQIQALKSIADVVHKLKALSNAVDALTKDEYKFEHCLDYYIKLENMLSVLTRRSSVYTLDSLTSSTLFHAAADLNNFISAPLEEATQDITNEMRLREATVQRLSFPPKSSIRAIKRWDRYEQANPRLRTLCDKLRSDPESTVAHWEFPLDDVCFRLKSLYDESMSLGPLLSVSLHRRTDSFDHEMVLIEFGGGALTPVWVRVERSAHWTQFDRNDSLSYDGVARAWIKDTIIFSCDHDYLAQSCYYVEVCTARYWPNGQSMHLDEVGDVIIEVAKEKLWCKLLEEDCRSFARRLFHRVVGAEPGALNSVTWRGRRCSVEDVLSNIHRYPWYTPGVTSRNLKSGENQVSILLEVACLQLRRNQASDARLAMEAAIDLATAEKHAAHLLPECFWILSHAHQALGDPPAALEFAMKAFDNPFSSARIGDFGIWLALCRSVVYPAINIKGALLDSLPALRHRSEETGYLEDKTACIRCLCLLSDTCRKESEELYQQTEKIDAGQLSASRAVEFGEEALVLAQDTYTPYLILSCLSLARAYVSLAEADYNGFDRPLFFLREASKVLGVDKGRVWTIEAELVADAALLHGSIAAAAASEQYGDVSLLMEARTALDYGICHCRSRRIRGGAIAELLRFYNDIDIAIRRRGTKDPIVRDIHRVDNRVWRGLSFLSKLLPRWKK